MISSAEPLPAFSGLLVWDRPALFFSLLLLATSALTLVLAHLCQEIEGRHYSEFCLLLLSVTLGLVLLARASDLLMAYVAFETMGVLSYLLVGLQTGRLKSGEAALKYVLYGGFATGIMLYGFSLIYGLAGATGFQTVSQALAEAAGQPQNRLVLNLAGLTLLTGLLFKTASFPSISGAPTSTRGRPPRSRPSSRWGPRRRASSSSSAFSWPSSPNPRPRADTNPCPAWTGP